MSESIRGVVVTHAGLGRALIEAVDRIVGLEDDALVALSNEGLGPAEIRDRLNEMVGSGPAILFTDLREGSCGMAAQHICLQHSDQVLVTGVNLPMLLDFVFHRELPLEELVPRLLEKGRGGVQALEPASRPS